MRNLLFALSLLYSSIGYAQVNVKATIQGAGNKAIVSYWKNFSFVSDTVDLKNNKLNKKLQFSEPAYVRFQTIAPEYISPYFLAFPGDTLSLDKNGSSVSIKGGPETYNTFLLKMDSVRKAESTGKRPDPNILAEFFLNQSDQFFQTFQHPYKQMIKAGHELSVITNYKLYNIMVKYSAREDKIKTLAGIISNPALNNGTADADFKFIDRIDFNSKYLDAANVIDIMMMNNLIRILRFQAVNKDSLLQNVDPYLIENKLIKEVFKQGRFRSRLMAYNLYSRIESYTQYPMQLAEVDKFIAEFKKESYIDGLVAPIETLYSLQLAGIGSLAKGAPAPGFKLPDVNGKQVALSDFKGKVVYIDLWASWCGPCLAEMPYLKKLKEKFDGKNVALISISIDTKKDKWLDKIASLKLDGVQLIDGIGSENSKIAKDYKIHGVPHYVLIDKNGRIASAFAPRPSEEADIAKEIDALLK